MMHYVTLTIDGAVVRAPKGSSVLDAAVHAGICIPHLCHMPILSDIGACRLCIVDHVRNGKSKITASCTLLIQEGMVIDANSEKVKRLRRNVAELLVTEAPNSRAIQDIALRCGVREPRYPFRSKDCVLCGRCVRACRELYKGDAIDFIGRGSERHVDFPYGVRPDSCKLCRACVTLCPMSVTPCDGPMKPGEERFCGKCASQASPEKEFPGICFRCDLGRGFSCARHQ